MNEVLRWSVVKNLPAKRDTGELGLIPRSEDPQEEEAATHFSDSYGNFQWTEERGGLQSLGSQSNAQHALKQNSTEKQPVCIPVHC